MRFDGLDLNLLVALDVLLETQSVTDASRQLHLSQPSVSAALSRLRDYFQDDLLTQIGRRMTPTAKGESLAPAIKEMLNLVRFKITNADRYDVHTSRRKFRVLASDYAYDILLCRVLAKAEILSPHVTFDIAPTGPGGIRQFHNGDIDVMITVSNYLVDEHPHALLFEDEDAVICWSEGRYAKGLNAAEFLEASHAVAVFGEERRPTISESHFEEQGIQRKIAVRVGSFSALPGAVVGTDRVALMHRRHAELYSKLYPITHHALPVSGPGVKELVQWHRLRESDPGARWLIDLMLEEAAQLDPTRR